MLVMPELELLLDEELLLELDELLLDEDEELELLEELDEDELLDELELLLDEELLELEADALIEPAEAVSVTLSNRAPSSRLTIRSVCAPAERLLKVAGVMVP
jgi:hypothetical protein